MSEILQNISAVIESVGWVGVFIYAVFNKILERKSAKHQLQLDKKLETHKHGLEKKNYVSKVRFDAEFVIYRELCSVITDEIINVIALLKNKEKESIKNYCAEIAKKAQDTLYGNAAFITSEIFTKFHEYHNNCAKIIQFYCFDFGCEMEVNSIAIDLDEYLKFMGEIRQYLSMLEVIE